LGREAQKRKKKRNKKDDDKKRERLAALLGRILIGKTREREQWLGLSRTSTMPPVGRIGKREEKKREGRRT